MGDRANVIVMDSLTTGVVLYTHWTGSELPRTLATALQRSLPRWDDPSYLARIIFCELVRGQEQEETGFGISTMIGDGGNRILVVDPFRKVVVRASGGILAEVLAFAATMKGTPFSKYNKGASWK